MSNHLKPTPTNFIRNIIDDDLAKNPDLKIHTRFPPEPNGYLHIGHAKSICLNFGIAKDYQGKCNLRFDDTNPTKENQVFVEAIKNDLKWLGFEPDGVFSSSNYFNKFADYATELIRKNLAYVCFLDAEQTREYRGTLTEIGKNSPYRDTSVEENLAQFAKMKNGEFTPGSCVLRAKIDMASAVICMRDPALYRILKTDPKSAWHIYPMYDFAHCISDAIEGISHSLCTLEFQDNRQLYDWILDNLADFNHPDRPHQYEFSRLNLESTIMSKRKLQQLVEEDLVSGWDDPRMPTLIGLRRRGYTPKSIRNFINQVGISKSDNTTDMAILEAAVRDDLNQNASRTMAVIDPIKVVIENYPNEQTETIKAPRHPQNEALGSRDILFSKELYIDRSDFVETAPNNKFKRLAINKEVRLRNAYIIRATSFEADSDGIITTIYATFDPDTLGKNPTDGRKVKGVIHFVEASHALPAEFHLFELLFKTPNPAETEHLKDLINPNSITIKSGFVEPTMTTATAADSYQFERIGYFCRDNQSKNLVFNKTCSLRETF